MGKATVQSLIIDKLNSLETKIDTMIPVVEGLKIKATIAGGIAGLVGTGLVTALLTLMKR